MFKTPSPSRESIKMHMTWFYKMWIRLNSCSVGGIKIDIALHDIVLKAESQWFIMWIELHFQLPFWSPFFGIYFMLNLIQYSLVRKVVFMKYSSMLSCYFTSTVHFWHFRTYSGLPSRGTEWNLGWSAAFKSAEWMMVSAFNEEQKGCDDIVRRNWVLIQL